MTASCAGSPWTWSSCSPRRRPSPARSWRAARWPWSSSTTASRRPRRRPRRGRHRLVPRRHGRARRLTGRDQPHRPSPARTGPSSSRSPRPAPVAARWSSSMASPGPRRTSPTGSTRSPSWAGTPSRPTSAATATSAKPDDEAAYSLRRLRRRPAGAARRAGLVERRRPRPLDGRHGAADRGAARRPSASRRSSSWTRRIARCAPTGTMVDLAIGIARAEGMAALDGRPGRPRRRRVPARHRRRPSARGRASRLQGVRAAQDAGQLTGDVRRHDPGHHRRHQRARPARRPRGRSGCRPWSSWATATAPFLKPSTAHGGRHPGRRAGRDPRRRVTHRSSRAPSTGGRPSPRFLERV